MERMMTSDETKSHGFEVCGSSPMPRACCGEVYGRELTCVARAELRAKLRADKVAKMQADEEVAKQRAEAIANDPGVARERATVAILRRIERTVIDDTHTTVGAEVE